MTDEEKASELLQLSEFPNNKNQCDAVFELLMQMAQWKNEQFKNKLDEFYKFIKPYIQKDDKEIYSNGIEYVPLFRIEHAIEFMKNNLPIEYNEAI